MTTVKTICRAYFDNRNLKRLFSIQIFSQVLVQVFKNHCETVFRVNHIIKSTDHSTMQFHEWPYSEYPPHANWAESSSTLQFHLSIIVQKRIANRWQCPSLGIRLRKYLVDIPCNGSHTLTNLIQLLVTLHIRVKTQRLSERVGIMEFQNLFVLLSFIDLSDCRTLWGK